MTLIELLRKLKARNELEAEDLMEQAISPPEPIIEAKVPSLELEKYQLMSEMLESRFCFASRWVNATAGLTWLSIGDMKNLWTDNQMKTQIAMRKRFWPTCVLNRYLPEKLGLFAIDADQKNEIYLCFDDADEPSLAAYIGSQEKKYENLSVFLRAWTK
jgi:hypothetical protein